MRVGGSEVLERECCGTFHETPHRVTCAEYKPAATEAITLSDVLEWAEYHCRLARTEGANGEETRIAWAILNAPR